MKLMDRKMNKKVSPFITKLIHILQDPQSQNSVSWVTLDTFVIVDSDDLSKNVLSKYFKHGNFSSFIRQLNIYGFEKVKTQQNHHYYHHKNFIRNNKRQLKLIQRKLKKSEESDNFDEAQKESNQVLKDKPQFKNQLKQLKKENNEMKEQNIRLKQQIQIIKQENKKEILCVVNFLNQSLKNIENNDESNAEKESEVAKKQLSLHSLKKQLLSLHKNQINNRKQKLYNILMSLDGFFREKQKKEETRLSKSAIESNNQQLIEFDIQYLPCRQEQNRLPQFMQSENNNEDLEKCLNLDDFF